MSALWLALHFPLLALEAEHGPRPEPRVLVRGNRVLLANPAARAAGVEAGLRLGTARALCEALEVHEARADQQHQALLREARQLLALTPQVCPAPPATVLLEVGGCLKLFGGFQKLLARVDRYRLHCPLTSRLGIGPTPLAAWHLTDPPVLEEPPEAARFQAWLADLPLAELDLDERLRQRLQAPGFRTLGELFPLPRTALGKRFGVDFLDWLQCLLGEKPDPRRPISPPRPFRERLDFDDPLDNLDQLAGPMSELLATLEETLNRHQESLVTLRWRLHLNNGHRDTLIVRRARQGHDAATWLDLSQRRLSHHELSAPVLGLSLDGGRPRPRNPGLAELFPDPGARPPLAGLLEKLAGEPDLGVYRPDRGDGHLPEETERGRAPLASPPKTAADDQDSDQDRPLWLLDPPRPLTLRNRVPHWRGRPLALFPQEERFSQPWHDLAAGPPPPAPPPPPTTPTGSVAGCSRTTRRAGGCRGFSDMDFAELHCTSAFTFLTGASQPEELVLQAWRQGYRALAITDDGSLAGVVRAYQAHKNLKKALEDEGRTLDFRLIVGSHFRLHQDRGELRLVLLARDRQAYGEIATLITRGRRRAEKGHYRLHWQDLTRLDRNALCLWLPAGDERDEHHAALLKDHFGERLWLACELLQDGNDALHYRYCYQLADRFGLAMAAANDVHYHRPERQRLQELLTALRLNTTVRDLGRRRFQNDQRHLRGLERLAEVYPPTLLEEAAWIAEQCHFEMHEIAYQYPEEVVPPGQNADDYLAALAHQGAEARYPDGVPDTVRALVDKELGLIRQLGYAHYFLTVHDIVAFARAQGILCQGRGSAANSAVCYCLGVTEVDPGRSQLLFERFISQERDEPPDIDVDFEHERREEVMQYLYRKYGRDRAALAATVIHYRTRSAVRDVGRALGVDMDIIERLSGNLAWWDKPDALVERFREVGLGGSTLGRHYRELVQELVGFPRHLSQHVGGFVITRDPVHTLVPVENAAMPDRTLIQWDKDDLESLGLMKVDVLALGMLTAIRKILDMVQGYRGRPLAMQDIPADDEATYDMLCKGDSLGVFQVESRAQMNMLPRLRPQKFYDLVVEVAIVRPGPIQGDMVHPYLRRRDGLEETDYPDDKVKAVLERTLGIPIFQEQVIKLVMVAAGFSGGEADRLRRAMARWGKSGELMEFESRVIDGMRANGYSGDYARRLFEQMKGFGGYGFPESHSASFALLVYVSAWLKRHHTSAFYCGLLNSLPMGFYSPSQILQDARRHGIEIRPVDARHSHWDHSLEEQQREKLGVQPALRLGFRQIKGFNPEAAQRLVQARDETPFTGVGDLCRRARLGQREREALVAGNALRGLSGHRHQAHWDVQGLEGQRPLLEDGPQGDHDGVYLDAPSEYTTLIEDYRHLGVSLGKHPMALVRHLPRFKRGYRAKDLKRARPGQVVRVAGLVTNRQRPGSAKGTLFMTLEDETGNTNVVIWSAIQERFRTILLKSPLVTVTGTVEISPEGIVHLMAGRLDDTSDALNELIVRSRDFK